MPAVPPVEIARFLQAPDESVRPVATQVSAPSRESPTFFCDNTTDFRVSAILAHLRQVHGPKTSYGLPAGPWHLEICPTSACQISCRFCSYDRRNESGTRLSEKVLAEVIDDAQSLGVVGLYWSGGGDPLAARNIANLIEASARYAGVAVQTNAVSLDRLLRHGFEWFNETCDLISWSVYAHEPQLFNETCRGSAAQFEKVVENIHTAVQYRDSWARASGSRMPPVHISGKIVVGRENFRAIHALAAFVRQFSFDTCHVRLVDNFEDGRCVSLVPAERAELYSLLDAAEDPVLQGFRATLGETSAAPRRCPRYSLLEGFNAIVETDGEVYLSIPSDGNTHLSIGNVNDRRLREIWGGERHRRVLDRLLEEDVQLSKDRHHKIDLAIFEWMQGESSVVLHPDLLEASAFRRDQRAQL